MNEYDIELQRMIENAKKLRPGDDYRWKPCPAGCKLGQLDGATCKTCHGRGVVTSDTNIMVGLGEPQWMTPLPYPLEDDPVAAALREELAAAKAEISAAHAAMDAAGLPRGSGPLDSPMTLDERVRGVIALPQRQRYDAMIAAAKAEIERLRAALERIANYRESGEGCPDLIARQALKETT